MRPAAPADTISSATTVRSLRASRDSLMRTSRPMPELAVKPEIRGGKRPSLL